MAFMVVLIWRLNKLSHFTIRSITQTTEQSWPRNRGAGYHYSGDQAEDCHAAHQWRSAGL